MEKHVRDNGLSTGFKEITGHGRVMPIGHGRVMPKTESKTEAQDGSGPYLSHRAQVMTNTNYEDAYREQPHNRAIRKYCAPLAEAAAKRAAAERHWHALAEIDSRGVILVREAGERSENTTHHRVGGARQRNVQQEALRAEAACELEDEVVCLGRGRGAQHACRKRCHACLGGGGGGGDTRRACPNRCLGRSTHRYGREGGGSGRGSRGKHGRAQRRGQPRKHPSRRATEHRQRRGRQR
eukprot:scaffold119360_cov57-Phaeocystis_antarctica.AAC.5